jgi:hypothetical protein
MKINCVLQDNGFWQDFSVSKNLSFSTEYVPSSHWRTAGFGPGCVKTPSERGTRK